MSEPLSTDRIRQLLDDLVRLIGQRTKSEQEIQARFASQSEAIEAELARARQELSQRYDRQRQALERDFEQARGDVLKQYEAERSTAEAEYQRHVQKTNSQAESALRAAKRVRDEARWEASTVFDATKNQPKLHYTKIIKQLRARQQSIAQIESDVARILAERRMRVASTATPQAAPADPSSGGPTEQGRGEEAPEAAADPAARLNQLGGQVEQLLASVRRQRVAALFAGWNLVWFVVLFAVLGAIPLGALLGWDWSDWRWMAGAVGLGLAGAGGLAGWLYPVARRTARAQHRTLSLMSAESTSLCEQIAKSAAAQRDESYQAIVQRRDQELARSDGAYADQKEKIEQEQQRSLDQVKAVLDVRMAGFIAERDRRIHEAEDVYPARLAQLADRHKQQIDEALAAHARRTDECRQTRDEQFASMAEAWRTGYERFAAAVDEINRRSLELFPAWPALLVPQWKPPTETPPALRFGQCELDVRRIRGGVPDDARLRIEPTRFELPAVAKFPQQTSMLLRAQGDGRQVAIETLQTMILRLLVALPPGKVRLTIIDPTGLGENFAAFMHLADFDELLVTSRIWTETNHIEQRLADLTEHMENVIQKYLRNEFESIEDYNRQAGEVAEPYRILVVANFPANFSEEAARRLLSIATTGPRCGVYTLVSVDDNLPLPHNFQLADLESQSLQFAWRDERFVWKQPPLDKLPLVLDQPPAIEHFTDIVRVAGHWAKDARRVEVPFEMVAPPENRWWSGDSRRELSVPLGRAGATKFQHLKLGKGTSQHVLLAGKTGSGKSTFLHALVTNCALHYSPEEVEFYLVDFKKGVEFKTYATMQLPHARVIAIESEREFGLSVLQKLDAELKRRGDLFRALGVQDLAGFRTARPDEKLPRVLLIIDEFQELFVEDDRLAQEAALLLDRLVRQGRAFGMHALMGSQTLGGAYSLARSTIGQMAVRIALQCSESDAHLILSEDNTAARLLTRPGEAIYNDANGLIEGNNPFQVVWLSDERRVEYLRALQELARANDYTPPPSIVFEGNAPADPATNHLLRRVITAPTWPEAPRAAHAWLGSAVAIKDPTSAIFRRQSGANMLVLGQRPESALAVLATGAVSLAAQHVPADPANGGGTRFYVLDGMPPDAPEFGYFGQLAKAMPHPWTIGSGREIAAVVAEVDAEVTRREARGAENDPPIYLIVYDLGRLRELRKTEDDFSFGRSEDKPASPSKQFIHILREGPAVGVHTLLWCDTYNNLTRMIERQGVRDFEIRVLFQMSGPDSSNLIDSPAASKLGVHRALLYSEDQAGVEKFRPYALPEAQWLAWVRQQLSARTAAETPIG